MICIPTGMVFGSNASPAEWMCIAEARAHIAIFLMGLYTMRKHVPDPFGIMNQVFLPPPAPPDTSLAQATPCTTHSGVMGPNGQPVPTPNVTFVHDNMLANICSRIMLAIYCSIEALFLLLGFSAEKSR